MSPGQTEGMSTHSILATSSFDRWIAEGTDVHLGEARRATMLTSSNTLTADIASRIAALRKLELQYMVVLNTSQSPLLRLPREIIELIISYTASQQHVRKWSKLGHISSALRSALLGLHRLWGDAVCTFPDGRHRDELLQRAGPLVPLRMYVPDNYLPKGRGLSNVAQFVTTHLERAGSINAAEIGFIDWFVQNVDSPALPYLEEVNLTGGYDPVIALNGSQRATPRLKYVRLTNVVWRFYAPNLTSLIMVFPKEARIYVPSQILDLLGQSNSLQVLRLDNCLPFFRDDVVAANKTELPSLRLLVVTDVRAYAIQMWLLLSVPSSTHVVMNLSCQTAFAEPTHPNYTGPSCFDDAVLFKDHLGNRQNLALTIEGDYYSSLCIVISSISTPGYNTSETAAVPPHAAYQPILSLAYLDCYDDWDNQISTVKGDIQKEALHRVCTTFNLFNVTHLSWMSDNTHDEADEWTSNLEVLANVEVLNVSKLNQNLGHALHAPPTQTQPFLLPRLRELTVKYAYLHPERSSGGSIDQQSLLIADLFALMHSRIARGQPLDVLKLSRLHVYSSHPRHTFDRHTFDFDEAKSTFIREFHAEFPDCRLEILPRDDSYD